ncbi:UDP-N-acetylglucosamine 2-epimerase [Phytoactinopolyspora halotolerans]|uniref:UDP-N-acetylglucosamine 2-epimerase (non-hydrolyzing) n=1 Tax=Phytoactinopolyspora halotolerans TaxID=1981512 RepID=A0A6L9SGR6_9ACTN|nr:UDP-N-acetylglucosamine 2-epimerase [Phytoactinopolyspora halotolerans]NEE03300.1 hypothetical protein [Phytoactinopolyspora halotolerans]
MRNEHAILIAYGSCAEAMNLAPVVLELRRCRRIRPVVGAPGAGSETFDQVRRLFRVAPELDLDLAGCGTSLSDVVMRARAGLTASLERSAAYLTARGIGSVLVDGDSTLSLAVAMVGFRGGLPVVHVNAGVTGSPPEDYPDGARTGRLIAQVASLHLAPTAAERRSLIDNGVDPDDIVVTGRLTVDTRMASAGNPFGDGRAAARVRAAVEELLGLGRRMPDFEQSHLV